MRIEDAIEKAEARAQQQGPDAAEQRQIAAWLKELRGSRAAAQLLREAIEDPEGDVLTSCGHRDCWKLATHTDHYTVACEDHVSRLNAGDCVEQSYTKAWLAFTDLQRSATVHPAHITAEELLALATSGTDTLSALLRDVSENISTMARTQRKIDAAMATYGVMVEDCIKAQALVKERVRSLEAARGGEPRPETEKTGA